LHEIIFYQKSDGETPVLDYMKALRDSVSKDSRIKLNKIAQYIKVLGEKGTRAGKPFVDHLDGDLWELRPLRDRILFASMVDGCFVLLHCFMKETPKTPPREIKQAKRELAD
jgi:phage-related protein